MTKINTTQNGIFRIPNVPPWTTHTTNFVFEGKIGARFPILKNVDDVIWILTRSNEKLFVDPTRRHILYEK